MFQGAIVLLARMPRAGSELRRQYDALVQRRFDRLAAERHRMIAPGGPIAEQVPIMLARRIAAFAGNVGHHATVPIAYVENFAPTSAVGLAKVGAAGGVDRVAVTGALDRAELPRAVAAGMRQRQPVQL